MDPIFIIPVSLKDVTAFTSLEKAHPFINKNPKAEVIGDMADLLEYFTAKQLVNIHNNLPGDHKPVKKFSSAPTGAKRIFAILETLPVQGDKTKTPSPNTEAQDVKDPTPAKPRKSKGVNIEPKAKVYPARAGSKQATLVDMLSRGAGATMAQLIEALSAFGKPWVEATVKSGFYWDMNSIKGYGIKTVVGEDGVAVYHLTYPEGITQPLPHTPLKTAPTE